MKKKKSMHRLRTTRRPRGILPPRAASRVALKGKALRAVPRELRRAKVRIARVSRILSAPPEKVLALIGPVRRTFNDPREKAQVPLLAAVPAGISSSTVPGESPVAPVPAPVVLRADTARPRRAPS
jgi:hypothetical protein